MSSNPFNEGTYLSNTYIILSDCNWHCSNHELPGTQPAKLIQYIRQNGYLVEQGRRLCPYCKRSHTHYRLISTEPAAASIIRQSIPPQLRQRVLKHYRNIEAVTQRKMQPNELEVDHRFPQVRWSRDEDFDPNMSDEKLHHRFQLLTRQNNLTKSRACERCRATGERGTFIGIRFFAIGSPWWDAAIPFDDERGCFGCFWYDPEIWRQSLNDLLNALPNSNIKR